MWQDREKRGCEKNMLIKIPRGWEIPERQATPESAYMSRRQLLARLGLAGIGGQMIAHAAAVKQNTEYNVGDRPVTEEWAATGYNNYYEFDPENKERVKDLVGKFVYLALQNVADGEDSDETAIVFDHGEMTLLVIDHDSGGLGNNKSGASYGAAT